MDIAELLRPLVDGAPPPPPLERLAARSRRRHRQRVVAGVLLSGIVVATVVGIGLASRSDHTTTKVVTARPPRSTTPTAPTSTTSPLPAVASSNRIAFTRARPMFGPGLETAEIVLVNADGSDEVQLTHAAKDGLVASQPAW